MPEKIRLEYSLEKVKQAVGKWLHLDDTEIIDVILATHIANRFNADPIWMLIIAPPSSTKTELLRGFKDHPDFYSLSTLTPSTLISGSKNSKDGKNPSLLFKLNDKTLILKDFTTILSMRSENQQEILSQLREIYDGYFSKAFGTGEEIAWEGHVGLIGACTPVYDSHYGVIGSMGDRFMLYRSTQNNNREMGLRAQKIVGREDEMRAEIKTAMHSFVDQFEAVEKEFDGNTDEINEMIVALACFCAIARCPVERDRNTRHVKYQPEPEGSGRLTKQLTQIGMALAWVREKNSIDESVFQTIKKIGQDLITRQRFEIIKLLWAERFGESFGGWEVTKEIAAGVKMPTMTTKLILEDLMVVGALNQDRENDAETAPYIWQLSQEVCELIGCSELFD